MNSIRSGLILTVALELLTLPTLALAHENVDAHSTTELQHVDSVGEPIPQPVAQSDHTWHLVAGIGLGLWVLVEAIREHQRRRLQSAKKSPTT